MHACASNTMHMALINNSYTGKGHVVHAQYFRKTQPIVVFLQYRSNARTILPFLQTVKRLCFTVHILVSHFR